MSVLDEITNTYEFGWNITRVALAEKMTYIEKTVFGDYIVKRDTGTLRDIEAERLFHKYSKMLMRGDQVKYCSGALDLIAEWDIINGVPNELNEDEEDDDEAYED